MAAMWFPRLVDGPQEMSDVLLALRRDARAFENDARMAANERRSEGAGRMLATAKRLTKLADRLYGELSVEERLAVERCERAVEGG